MRLFQTREKKTQRIVTFRCPHCGKEHNVPYFKVKSYYLDGTPKDLEGALSQIIVCDCGCVCKEGMTTWSGLSQIINSAEYQTLLRAECNEMEKKLHLMTFFPLSFTFPEVWLTHLVHNDQLLPALQMAIQRIQQLKNEYAQLTFGQVVKGCYMTEFQWKYEFFINDNLLLSDLYRRSGQFTDAAQLLEVAEDNKQNAYLQNYIAFQRKLISAHNSQYQ